jgi:putative mycofactocin binding protein MftB
MACAASTDDMPSTFDERRAWALHDRVALRRESFGALAYHFGTRRLSFLKHPTLVGVVEALAEHPSAAAACSAAGVEPEERTAMVHALRTLAETGMIVERAAP